MTKKKDYEVGFGRPPLGHQFTKGVSGNPAGRPKGSKNISAIITAILAQRVTVTSNGKRRSMSKLEAGLTQAANKSAGGDRHHLKFLIDSLHQSEIRDQARSDSSPLSADERRAQDEAILAFLRDSACNVLPEGDDDEAAS
jgi:hypothetical protein